MPYGYVRLQDMNLSYVFRQQKLKSLGVHNLQIYLAAKNLFTITGWKGGDPEKRLKYRTFLADNVYPLQRTFSLGMNLSF
jgi:hypothetical protein